METCLKGMEKGKRLPGWLKMQRASGANYTRVKQLVTGNNLHTICTSGNCPNIGECWNAGTATFMILGDVCTRACKFCGTKTGKPLPPDEGEPERLALSINKLALRHCVITSVDRDDLPDKGAAFWAKTIETVKRLNPGLTIETLIPDFDGREDLLDNVISAGPDVISHNVETVRRLTPLIRTRARYERSLAVLKYLADRDVTTKSGFMVGLGEDDTEIREIIGDISQTGCSVLTIGQYLRPGFDFMEPVKYYTPDEFESFRVFAMSRGFRFVESSPLVRSSYHAERHVAKRENL
ncbi:MAG: lipoyl synthase [Bacteroidales bacterium]